MTGGRVDQVSIGGALRNHELRLGSLEASPIVRWVVVGTYPADPGTSPDSPPWQNGWGNAGSPYELTAFARNLAGFMHFRGAPVGGADGTVMFTITDPHSIPASDILANYATPDPAHIATVKFGTDGTVTFMGLS